MDLKPRDIPFNSLSGTGITSSRKISAAIERVVKSGSYILGQENIAFEIEFAQYLGVKFALGVASGTDALRIALQTVGCGSGDTVITVSNAGGYSTLAALSLGSKVEFCDINEDTHLIDIAELKRLLRPEISAVVITHLYGNIVDFSSIISQCRELNIAIIEDCAQSLGGTIGSTKAGALGDISTFSFYPTKNLGAAGDGGAICTNNSNYFERMVSLRQYGWKEKYQVEIAGGINSRLDELQAAILRVQLESLDDLNAERRLIINNYSTFFANSEIELVSDPRSFAPHLAVVKLPERSDRDEVKKSLSQAGVSSSIHYPFLDNEQKGFGFDQHDWTRKLERTIRANKRIFTLPMYPGISEEDTLYISRKLISAINSGVA